MHGRTVTVLKHNGKVYAIDTACFHQGGPLGTEGDIEDINGVACLHCPWHGFKVEDMAVCGMWQLVLLLLVDIYFLSGES